MLLTYIVLINLGLIIFCSSFVAVDVDLRDYYTPEIGIN